MWKLLATWFEKDFFFCFFKPMSINFVLFLVMYFTFYNKIFSILNPLKCFFYVWKFCFWSAHSKRFEDIKLVISIIIIHQKSFLFTFCSLNSFEKLFLVLVSYANKSRQLTQSLFWNFFVVTSKNRTRSNFDIIYLLQY